MYDIPEASADSFKLPYLGGAWTDFARMFDLTLEELNLQGHEVILDFGAGQGWAARYFAAKGCCAVAMDIVADEWWGLGRAWAIMEHANVYFEPVLADGENLPFFPETFDVIFLSAALHHFDKPDRVLAQIYQVLKPGGRIVAASEPAIAIWQKEKEILPSLEEVEEGIIERRPKTFQYRSALKRAGFSHIQIDTFETYRAAPANVYQWIKTLKYAQYQAVRTRYKLIIWLIYTFALILPVQWAVQVALSVSGGNLFIRAIKSAKM
jgi:SAM-dependent methyltransferase